MGSGGVEKKVRTAALKELPGSVPPGPASDTGASGPERGRDSLGPESRPLPSAASGFCLSPLLTWENRTPACESVSWGSAVSSLPSRGAVRHLHGRPHGRRLAGQRGLQRAPVCLVLLGR